MRSALTAIALLSAPAVMADVATVRKGLSSGCVAGLPDFGTATDRLAERGWETRPGASATERDAGKGAVNVFINTGDGLNAPGCTVMSSDVAAPAAQTLLEQQLDRGFAGKWKTAPGDDGSKSWVVPGNGASLVMYVLGGDSSGVGPGSGISLSVRRDN